MKERLRRYDILHTAQKTDEIIWRLALAVS